MQKIDKAKRYNIHMRTFQTLLMALFALQAMAGSITPEKAMKNARDFLIKNSRADISADLRLVYRCERENHPDDAYFYVYNVGQDKGFMILSGVDSTDEVLGYCDHGSFDQEQMPDNLRWWMQYYEESMKYAADHPTAVASAQNRPTVVVEPMIMTRWNQDWPYNDRCPSYNGAKCPTGCVATAMAQLLYYHKYPNTPTLEIPGYQCESINKYMPGLPAITFDWDKMKHTYNMFSSQESIDAVSMLMLYCGQLVEMGYSPEGSGANTGILTNRLPKYFNYPNTIHEASRTGYSIEQWDSLLLYELTNNRPVLYTGYTSAFEGHAFICDGYDGNGLYHINWGWGGAADGYYRISVLDATANGIGGSSTSLRFSLLQSALLGVKTEGEDEFVAPAEKLTVSGRPSLKDGRNYQRNAVTGNFSGINISYDVVSQHDGWGTQSTHGLCLYDDQGEMVKNIVRKSDYFWSQYPMDVEFLNVSISSDIADGHYTLRPVFSDGSKWVMMAGADKNYIDVLIDGDDMTLTPVPKADFEVSKVEKMGRSVAVTLTNPDEEYNGVISLCKMNGKGDIEMVAFEYVAIEAGDTRTIYIYLPDGVSLNLEKDVYFLTVDNYVEQYFYSNVNNSNAELEKSLRVLNLTEDGQTVVGDKVMTELTITNQGSGEYHHFIYLTLCDEEGVNVSDEYKEVVDIQPGSTLRQRIDLPINDYSRKAAVNATHIVGKNTNESVTSDMYVLEKGAVYWNTEGKLLTMPAEKIFVVPDDALAINLRAAYTSDVRPNANPNTIYMLNKSVPKGLKGYNIVNFENKSGNLVLTDGYDFLIPETLTATNSVKYKRTFSAEESGSWSTLWFPFQPADITIEGKKADWFHNASESNQAFWIQTLKDINQDMAVLDYADSLAALTPYFIAINEAIIGKTVEFTAGPTVLNPTSESPCSLTVGGYTWTGANVLISREGIFSLSDNRLVYSDEPQTVAPFRAFLVKEDGSMAYPVISLQGPDITDGIIDIADDHRTDSDEIYHLSGVKVSSADTLHSLPKGIYIIKGQKIIVK